MMLLRDTLVYDSENWSADQPFPVVSLLLCLGPSFIGAVIKVHWRLPQNNPLEPSWYNNMFSKNYMSATNFKKYVTDVILYFNPSPASFCLSI